MFDISQTEGEPLPELETEASGDASELLPVLLEVASSLDVDVEVVSPTEWTHGDAKGICQYRSPAEQPLIEVRNRENSAALAVTLVHEYAHARLHGDGNETDRSKRELEAEAVGYIVGRYFGLDTSGSAFYLAAWEGDEPEAIFDRLERISSTAAEIVDVVDEVMVDE